MVRNFCLVLLMNALIFLAAHSALPPTLIAFHDGNKNDFSPHEILHNIERDEGLSDQDFAKKVLEQKFGLSNVQICGESFHTDQEAFYMHVLSFMGKDTTGSSKILDTIKLKVMRNSSK